MKKLILTAFLFLLILSSISQADEIIVMVRHGEKTVHEKGQLSCQGLNRSLMLPDYFKQHFPKPNYIFAPNPSVQLSGFSYARPLATIEPTAISLSMPVSTQIGYDQPNKLMTELLKDKYHQSVAFVAWEHLNIEAFTKLLLKKFGSNAAIPDWSDSNYNMVYVFRIHWDNKAPTLDFTVTSEGFRTIKKSCPHIDFQESLLSSFFGSFIHEDTSKGNE